MSKERRLGRGLEALLGFGPSHLDPPDDEQSQRESQTGEADFDQLPTDQLPAHQAPIGQSPADQFPAEPAPSGEPHLGVPEPTLPAHWPASPPSDIAMPPAPPMTPDTPPADGTRRLDVSRIDSNPMQPRKEFDPAETRSLAESLATHGLLQPVVVRRVDDRYQLIAGERRLRAAREAGWADVPANVVEADERQMAELAIVENLQRKDLNPLEKAAAFLRYLELYGCTQEELATRLRLDRSTVSNLIRLLELPERVQEAIRQGKITQGHARALLPLGEEREQVDFCQRIQAEGLSVRQTESLVQEMIDAADRGPLGVIHPMAEGHASRRPKARSEHLAALEQELRSALGTKVTISHNARGRGKLVIHFRSHEEFERLRHHLAGVSRPDQPQARAG